MNITVRSNAQQNLSDFLENHDYLVEVHSTNILSARIVGGPTVYIAQEQGLEDENQAHLYFELSLGRLGSLEKNAEVLYKLLDLNSEIVPVSVAINSEGEEPELCLVGSLECENLDSNEVLSVLEAMGLACLRVQQLLD